MSFGAQERQEEVAGEGGGERAWTNVFVWSPGDVVLQHRETKLPAFVTVMFSTQHDDYGACVRPCSCIFCGTTSSGARGLLGPTGGNAPDPDQVSVDNTGFFCQIQGCDAPGSSGLHGTPMHSRGYRLNMLGNQELASWWRRFMAESHSSTLCLKHNHHMLYALFFPHTHALRFCAWRINSTQNSWFMLFLCTGPLSARQPQEILEKKARPKRRKTNEPRENDIVKKCGHIH